LKDIPLVPLEGGFFRSGRIILIKNICLILKRKIHHLLNLNYHFTQEYVDGLYLNSVTENPPSRGARGMSLDRKKTTIHSVFSESRYVENQNRLISRDQ
jgi:hypothetical protein